MNLNSNSSLFILFVSNFLLRCVMSGYPKLVKFHMDVISYLEGCASSCTQSHCAKDQIEMSWDTCGHERVCVTCNGDPSAAP